MGIVEMVRYSPRWRYENINVKNGNSIRIERANRIQVGAMLNMNGEYIVQMTKKASAINLNLKRAKCYGR